MKQAPTDFDAISSCIEEFKNIVFDTALAFIHPKDYRKVFPYSLIQLVKFQIKRNKRLRHKRR